MRIMVDTNILFSSLLFPNSVPAKALMHAAKYHSLVLCDYVIAELYDTISRKRSDLMADTDVLLTELSYEIQTAPREPSKLFIHPKDAPILNAAVLADVDVLLSGDKHFLSLNTVRPKTLTAAAFMQYIEDALP